MAVALAATARGCGGTRQRLLAAGAGALVAAAILTKLLAVTAVPAVAILLVAGPGSRRAAAGQLAAASAGGLAAMAALLLPFAGSWPQLWEQSVGLHVRARAAPTGGIDVWTVARELPLAALAGVGAVAALRRAPVLVAAGTAWVLAAVLLLAVHRPLWPHHVLVLSAPLALLAGPAAQLLGSAPGRLRHAPVVGLLLVAATLAAALHVRSLATPDSSRQPAVAALRATTSRGDLVITDDQYSAALARRRTPPELVDTSQVRVLSGDLTAQQVEVAAERWHVRAVLLDMGSLPSLSLLPGLQEWLVERFPTVLQVGGGRVLYLRPPPHLR